MDASDVIVVLRQCSQRRLDMHVCDIVLAYTVKPVNPFPPHGIKFVPVGKGVIESRSMFCVLPVIMWLCRT